MRKILPTGAAVLAATVLAAQASAQKNLSAETASPGGTPHLSVTHLAEVAGEAGVANLQVQAGQTLTNTVLNVAQGKTDVGVSPLVLPFLLKVGRGPYAKQGKAGAKLVENLRALYPYNFGSYTLFGFQTRGITSWDQLKGKTIYNGPPRGGALVGARQMMQLVTGLKEGEGYKGIQVNWPQATKTIMDGTADMNLLPATFPSDRIVAALSAGKVNVLSVPKAVFESAPFQKWAKAPGNARVALEGSKMGYGSDVRLYSKDGIYRGVNITGAEIVNKSMDFELAKALTAAYVASIDRLMSKAPFMANVNLGVLDATKSGFCGAMPLKYHPGAVAAWQEAGYKVPDCAKP